jgi:hypothetical protein
MYEIIPNERYIVLRFSGFVGEQEMREWLSETQSAMATSEPAPFVMVDLRQMSVLPKAAVPLMEQAQRGANESGLVRSVIIVKSAIIQMQFERMAKTTGIYDKERYISAETNPNWESAAEAWLLSGIEPN